MNKLEESKDIPSLRYSKRKVKNNPTADYFLLSTKKPAN